MSKVIRSKLKLKSLILTVTTCCCIHLATATELVKSQVLDKRITLDVDEKSLKETLDIIGSRAKVGIIYSNALGVIYRPLTIHQKDQTVRKILNDILSPLSLTFEVIDGRIVIKFNTASSSSPSLNKEAAFKLPIKGKVTNVNGLPLNGATVKVKGGRVLTATDKNGSFEVNNFADSTVLQISFVGYTTKEIVIGSQSEINIVLISINSELQEVNVVSTGYQTLPKERATGSFDQIDNKLLNRGTGTNILDRLNGVTSGLRFNGTALGNVSTNPSDRILGINIRGESTLSNSVGRDPLIVLDNFPYEGNISNLNPNDIESITVLKDAAAASIWGARSGNGVIVITTKKGKKNQPISVDFVTTFTLQNKPNLYYDRNFLPAFDYIDVETDLFKKGYYDSYLNDVQSFPAVSPVVDILDKQRKGILNAMDANSQINAWRQNDVRKDYEKYMYQKAFKQQYSIGLRGGTNVNTYAFSMGYDNNQDNLVRNGFDRVTINAFNIYSPAKKLEITTAINYSENTTFLNNSVGYGSLNVGGPISGIYPYAPLADENSNPLSIVKDYRASYVNSAAGNGFLNWNYNPINELNLADNTAKVNALLLKAGAKYSFTSYLNAEVQYQRERQRVDTRNYQSPDSYAARNFYNQFTLINPTTHVATNQAPAGGFLDLGTYNLLSQNGRLQVNFNKNFNNSHEITALAGTEIRDIYSSGYSRSAIGYSDEFGTAANILNYVDFYQISPYGYAQLPTPNNSTRSTTNRFISYFANAAYTYNGLYTITLSGRKDGANIFGVKTNDKITPLWSGGLAYNISKASFYHNDWLPYLKLRATYGFNGNVYNGSAYVTGTYSTNSLTGAKQITNLTAPNPELSWEKVRNINIGIDFATKGSRLSGVLEYYKKDGQNLIETVPLFSSSGFRSFAGNAAATTTHGFDITISGKIVEGIFQWNTTVLLSTLKDKVKKYDIIYSNSTIRLNPSGGIPSVGNSLYGIYSYRWAGLDPNNGDPQGYLNGKISKDYTATINNFQPDSLVYSGPGRPSVYGAFRNDFLFKNFTLSANIGYSFGYVFRRGSTSLNEADLISAAFGQHADYSNRWQTSGDEAHTDVPSLIYPSNNNRNLFYQYSQALVANASNIRLLDVRLAYDLNKQQWHHLPLKSFQVFTYASNLGIIWRANKYGLDPDVPSFQSHIYPNPFTISFGFNAHF